MAKKPPGVPPILRALEGGAKEGAGGVDLSHLKKRTVGMNARTTTTKTLMSVEAGIVATEEDGVCVGYQLIIKDPSDFTVYIYPFGDEIRDAMLELLQEFPREGEPMPQDDDQGPERTG